MLWNRIRTGLLTLAVIGITGCGGGGGSDAGAPVLPGTGSGTGTGTGSGTGTTGTAAAPTVLVNLASATITPANPTTVTVSVRDAKGLPIAATVVDFSTQRTGLATVDVSSAATDANGLATATLRANTTGVSGADNIVAVARLGTTTIQGSTAFTVAGSAPTLQFTASTSTVSASTGAVTLRAVLKDAAGVLVRNAVVNFTAVNGRLKLSAPSAVTDGFGEVSLSATVVDPSSSAAEVVTAQATVGTVDVASALAVQLKADKPSIQVALSSLEVAASPVAKATVTVKDTSGNKVPAGTLVTFTSTFGLTAFSATTASTDAAGEASVSLTPKLTSSNGADQIVASATVGGVAISTSSVVQVRAAQTTLQPKLSLSPIPTSVSAASPAVVKATFVDGNGSPIRAQVVTFNVVRGLAQTSVNTALTDQDGAASVLLTPTMASSAGADEVTASLSYGGVSFQSTVGFQVQATEVRLTGLSPAVSSPLSAYGQTTLTVALTGAGVGSPASVTLSSSCVTQGKATISPASFTAKSTSVQVQYRDNGCGAVQSEDLIDANITGTTATVSTRLGIASPRAASLGFVSATPEVIYLKGSGLGESSALVFELRDGAGNPLPNRTVELALSTSNSGVTLEGGASTVTQQSDAQGRVIVRVNSGGLPTPIRVSARYTDSETNAVISTVSSNLSVAVGLPSQLNFSFSQVTQNIEGFNIDGTPNTYNIYAADRVGNPVPAGTAINFVTEGGQIESSRQIQLVGGLAAATSRFVSSSPRPVDGRVTVTAYALGEESFIDLNGNNQYDPLEPFLDLGHLFRDRNFDGLFDSLDEFLPTGIDGTKRCVSLDSFNSPSASALLKPDASIPSRGGLTCDGAWSGAGQVFVRRSLETVLSTSASRLLWAGKQGIPAGSASCLQPIRLHQGSLPNSDWTFHKVWPDGSSEWQFDSSGDRKSTVLPFTVADANTYPDGHPFTNGGLVAGRLNPMAAGTRISAATSTRGASVAVISGAAVPSTTEATFAAVSVTFDDTVVTMNADVTVSVTSPSGLVTSYQIKVMGSPSIGPSCP